MIAVTGATGHLGKLVVNDLIKQGADPKTIVALVRDTSKAQDLVSKGVNVRVGNYDSENSMVDALSGVDRLLLISGNEVGKRLPQHTNAINAAIKAKVKFIAYTSIVNADKISMKLAEEHLATEKLIKASGIPYAILRNSWYFENYTGALQGVLASGTVAGSAQNGKISAAARADYAAAAATILLGKGKPNTVYELGGPAFTMPQYAAAVAKVSGKKVEYKDMPENDYANLLTSFGLPAGYAHILANSDAGAAKNELYTDSNALEELIGRKPVTLEKALQEAITFSK